MTDLLATAKPVLESAILDRIALVEASVSTRINDPEEAEDVELELSHVADLGRRLEDRSFVVDARIRVQVAGRLVGTEGAVNLVSIHARYSLLYSLPGGVEVSNDSLRAFAKVNGPFSAWPYWREFVQSTLQRMGLPTVLLPVFRLRDILASSENIDPSQPGAEDQGEEIPPTTGGDG